jgi:hypothetical protein
MLEDFSHRFGTGLYDAFGDLDWKQYRGETLRLDPAREEARLNGHIAAVEKLLGSKLEGEAVLFGAFTYMDGYARFDRGTHRVFLGVDESHERGAYLDVLLTHELTHVVHESAEAVWRGWGLDPKMSHDDFVENLPVLEHLFNEGLSCVVSEILNPGELPGGYAYQTEDLLAECLRKRRAIDAVVHAELSDPEDNYFNLYDVSRYRPRVPRFAHYVWAWQWVKSLAKEAGRGDLEAGVRKLAYLCPKDFHGDALSFSLPDHLT